MGMIVRASFARATGCVFAAAVLAALGAGIGAASASAATSQASCSDLQMTISEVAKEPNHGEGDVIVLNGFCDGESLGSATGVTLPAESSISIEGAPGTTSGFDGAGVTDPLLGTAGSKEAGAITLSHLTFEHAQDVSALSIRASQVTLSDDSFLENEEHGDSEHAAFVQIGPSDCPPAGHTAITLDNSTFSSNKLVLGSSEGGGAGAWLEDTCASSRNVLEDNTFEGNVLEAEGTAEGGEVTGGGLRFVGSKTQPTPVSQSGNVFDSNRTVAPAPDLGNYGGGGEWLEDVSLLSIGDRFSRNTIAGTSSESELAWSWGAGLGIRTPECEQAALPASTLENAVVAGNAIGLGNTAALGGGGVWVGCSHLRVLDSTVTLNTAPNGAGIEGEPFDRLELVNSIVAEDSPGNEITSFNGSGGSVTAGFSDVCSYAGSSEPLPGPGNICANPLLADNGNPSSFDVHETTSSPTIDAGSNALVPSGLTTDFYGTPRILAGRIECTGSVPAVVDMGAVELQPATPSCPATIQKQAPGTGSPPALGLTHFVSLETSSTGAALKLSCSSSNGQGCSGTIFITCDETLQGNKIVAVTASNRTQVPVRIAQASFSLAAGATATFQVKLNSTGQGLLHQLHAISAWVLANETMADSNPVIFLLHDARFSEPKRKHKQSKKHKTPRSKRRRPGLSR